MTQSRSLRWDALLLPDDWRLEGEETTLDRGGRVFIDDLAVGRDNAPADEDLAMTGFVITGAAGSRLPLPIFEFSLLLTSMS